MPDSETETGLIGRRFFLRAAALAAAAPIVTEATLARAAQSAAAPPTGMALHGQAPGRPPADAVLINANEIRSAPPRRPARPSPRSRR